MSEDEDNKRLCEMLQTATARELPEEALLDDETAQFRERWLALVELLADCSDEVDPDRILAAVRPMRRRCARWPLLVAAGVLAASFWGAVALLRTESIVPPPAPPPYAPASVAAQSPAGPGVEQEEPSGAELDWDDSFDVQIAQARQMVLDIRQSWVSDRKTYMVLQRRLDELKQHLGEEAL